MEMAILGIAPGALGVMEALDARAELVDAPLRRCAIKQEVPVALVMVHGVEARVIHRRVADVRLVDGQVLVEKEKNRARLRGQVFHRHLLEVHVVDVVHGVVDAELDAQLGMDGAHVRHQRIGEVAEGTLPGRLIAPRKPAVHINAERAPMPPDVV